MDQKTLCVKRIGWRRIARNTMRFGWDTEGAEMETTTTTRVTGVSGKFDHYDDYDKTLYLRDAKIKTEKETKVRVWLSFTRDKSMYDNMLKVTPIEILYNIIFLIRRIASVVMPFAWLACFAMVFFFSWSKDMDEYFNAMISIAGAITGAWILGIILENILARIAGKILGIKIVSK